MMVGVNKKIMKSLEEEARKYATEGNGILVNKRKEHFIAGANSKWVQFEKIKAQIEVLKEAYNKPSQTMNMLVDLEQQLKQLSDDQ
jgi:uncharacterized membrane protein YgaE (UPF0421/DUF939 family)